MKGARVEALDERLRVERQRVQQPRLLPVRDLDERDLAVMLAGQRRLDVQAPWLGADQDPLAQGRCGRGVGDPVCGDVLGIQALTVLSGFTVRVNGLRTGKILSDRCVFCLSIRRAMS
jgi:hypothetical protein